jgi:hypothetical protein
VHSTLKKAQPPTMFVNLQRGKTRQKSLRFHL